MTNLNDYVKVAEAAEILGSSKGTVRTWVETGKIPMHRNPVNGYRLFRRTDLNRFLATLVLAVRSNRYGVDPFPRMRCLSGLVDLAVKGGLQCDS